MQLGLRKLSSKINKNKVFEYGDMVISFLGFSSLTFIGINMYYENTPITKKEIDNKKF